jgi:CubicO group peptidase (beta-lactamase class C family)
MRWIFLCLLAIFVLLGSCEDDAVLEERRTEDTDSTTTDSTATDTTGNDPADPPPTSPPPALSEYFPPINSDTWETIHPDSLHWNQQSLNNLLSFLATQNTYGFIVLYKGRIVTENYWNGWDRNTKYPIQSAGKSITAVLMGIAQQEGLLKISDPTSKYLGVGWSAAGVEKENRIRLQHHLSMTTGLDENETCMAPECFKYKADAGTRWAYHNAAYNLLNNVIEKASGMSIDDFTKVKLADKIGLKNWSWQDYVIDLSARDMARFGLLIDNKGSWNGQGILTDANYFDAMTSSSNSMNPSYGYLWWLNGKASYMVPFENDVKPGSLTSNAPGEMFAAMGKGDKKVYIIPGKNLVVVRHGEDAGTATFGPSSFDSELWKRLTPVIQSMPNK